MEVVVQCDTQMGDLYMDDKRDLQCKMEIFARQWNSTIAL